MAEPRSEAPGFRPILQLATILGGSAGALFGAWAGTAAAGVNAHLTSGSRVKLYLLFVLLYGLLGLVGGAIVGLPAGWLGRGRARVAPA